MPFGPLALYRCVAVVAISSPIFAPLYLMSFNAIFARRAWRALGIAATTTTVGRSVVTPFTSGGGRRHYHYIRLFAATIRRALLTRNATIHRVLVQRSRRFTTLAWRRTLLFAFACLTFAITGRHHLPPTILHTSAYLREHNILSFDARRGILIPFLRSYVPFHVLPPPRFLLLARTTMTARLRA